MYVGHKAPRLPLRPAAQLGTYLDVINDVCVVGNYQVVTCTLLIVGVSDMPILQRVAASILDMEDVYHGHSSLAMVIVLWQFVNGGAAGSSVTCRCCHYCPSGAINCHACYSRPVPKISEVYHKCIARIAPSGLPDTERGSLLQILL